MQAKANKLHYQNYFVVSKERLRGSLAMRWSSKVTVEIKSFNKHHVDSAIQSENRSYLEMYENIWPSE